MKNAILFVIVVSVATYANGRVYYLENLNGARNNDAIYPIVEQQASRDLDLAFSAGDPLENESIVSPSYLRKVSKRLEAASYSISIYRNCKTKTIKDYMLYVTRVTKS